LDNQIWALRTEFAQGTESGDSVTENPVLFNDHLHIALSQKVVHCPGIFAAQSFCMLIYCYKNFGPLALFPETL
jgi:hypothetical protein